MERKFYKKYVKDSKTRFEVFQYNLIKLFVLCFFQTKVNQNGRNSSLDCTSLSFRTITSTRKAVKSSHDPLSSISPAAFVARSFNVVCNYLRVALNLKKAAVKIGWTYFLFSIWWIRGLFCRYLATGAANTKVVTAGC